MEQKTRILVHTEFGNVEFVGKDPWAADKKLKSKLRKIHLSIKKLYFVRETDGPNDELHILYTYEPTTFRYDRALALALCEQKGSTDEAES